MFILNSTYIHSYDITRCNFAVKCVSSDGSGSSGRTFEFDRDIPLVKQSANHTEISALEIVRTCQLENHSNVAIILDKSYCQYLSLTIM